MYEESLALQTASSHNEVFLQWDWSDKFYKFLSFIIYKAQRANTWSHRSLTDNQLLHEPFPVLQHFVWCTPPPFGRGPWGPSRHRKNRDNQRFGQSCCQAMCCLQLLWWTGLHRSGQVLQSECILSLLRKMTRIFLRLEIQTFTLTHWWETYQWKLTHTKVPLSSTLVKPSGGGSVLCLRCCCCRWKSAGTETSTWEYSTCLTVRTPNSQITDGDSGVKFTVNKPLHFILTKVL